MSTPCGTFNETYQQDMAVVRTKEQWLMLVVFLGFVFAFPFFPFASSRLLSIINITAITIITVLGLQILTGYAGQISLGQAAFMAVGAFTAAILTTKFNLSFWVALPCAGVSAGIAGLIFGLPALRIKGLYLIMTTVAAHFIIIWVITILPEVTGGADGMPVVAPAIGGTVFKGERNWYFLVMGLAMLMTFFAKNLIRTRVGRAWIAIRDNDLAAEVMGINVFGYKMLAFFICSFYAGIAGCLFSFHIGIAHPDLFGLMAALWYLGMLIVGGMGSILGAILGTVFIRLLDEIAVITGPMLVSVVPPVLSINVIGATGMITTSVVIILFLLFEPRGLSHRWELFKSAYRLFPFSYRI